MQKFKSGETLQIFTSIHSQIYNHFNHQRHLQKRAIFKQQNGEAIHFQNGEGFVMRRGNSRFWVF
jgi:putative transposase